MDLYNHDFHAVSSLCRRWTRSTIHNEEVESAARSFGVKVVQAEAVMRSAYRLNMSGSHVGGTLLKSKRFIKTFRYSSHAKITNHPAR